MKARRTCFSLACTLLLLSCGSVKNSQRALHLDKSFCNKQAITLYTKADLPKPIHELQLDTSLTNRFSIQSLNMANAIGVMGMLSHYINQARDYGKLPTIEKKISLIELSQHINQKISIASLEISAIASELDCEEERAKQFAYYLKEKEGKVENGLIISSIIVGAAGAICAEVVSNNNPNSNLSSGLIIGVSLIEASLGALMLINKRKVEFYHPANELGDIWSNAIVSNYFPPSIWYYLTYENPAANEKSLARLLVDKWIIFGQVTGDENSKNETYELYFGKGGKYGANELKNRADMLDQTEAYVTLMKQDLKILTYEIEKLFLRP